MGRPIDPPLLQREKIMEKSIELKLLEEDPISLGNIYFSNHFKKNSPRFHYELMYSALRYQFLAIASPRKSAKSTYLSFLYPFHKILFKKEKFIVLLSN